MAQPPDYDRLNDFTNYQSINPQSPLPGLDVDQEYNAIKLTLDVVLANLAIIQRDDGKLGNQTVHKDAFDESALALIAGGWKPRGVWVTATSYEVSDVVAEGTSTYVCSVAHVSAALFSTDLAASKWQILGTLSETGASGVSFTPAGSIQGDNVQIAIEELDTDVVADRVVAGDLATTVSDMDTAYKLADTNHLADLNAHGISNFGSNFVQEQNASDARDRLNLETGAITVVGTAAVENVGLSAGNVVQVLTGGKLPVLDGSNLTGVGDGGGGGLVAATNAQMEAAAANDRAVTPGRFVRSPHAAKAYVIFDGVGNITIRDSFGVSSVGDGGGGNFTVNLSKAFSTAFFAVVATSKGGSKPPVEISAYAISANQIRIDTKGTNVTTGAVVPDDHDGVSIVCYGDQ